MDTLKPTRRLLETNHGNLSLLKKVEYDEYIRSLFSSNPVHIPISFYAYSRDEAKVLVSGWGMVCEGIGGRWLYPTPINSIEILSMKIS